ncbi:thiamine pyrophosphate-binding protein [Spiractinospora alimapuensis]|nr:thiamine pyrophosphate-binding protein [Spiractinospora alimapuensis]
MAYAVGETIARLGARRCFGVVGSGNFHVTVALRAAGVEFVAARHENHAVTMADAYARLTGELTLVSLHPGPGLTNATTGIAEAARSRTPLLVLAGTTANGALRSNFRIDQEDLARSVEAVAERLHSPHTALADTARAVERAMWDRRTVVLNMPLDVQDAPLPENTPLPVARAVANPPIPTPEAVGALADAVEGSRRPLVLAGRGAVLSGAGKALRELADRTGALLATTACGHGLFADDRWSVGISGGFSSNEAARLIRESDLILGFGASLTQWTTRHGRLIGPATTVAQIDVEPGRLGSQRDVDLPVVGDVSRTAAALRGELDARGHVATSELRTAEAAERVRKADNHHEPFTDTSTEQHIDPRTLSMRVDELLPADRTVVVDSGHFMGWPARYFRVADARSWCFTQGFQSIGLGLPTAIGAARAAPDRLVLAGVGDGGFLMSIAELETAVRLDITLCVVVYDDAAYAAEVHHFGPEGHPTDTVRFPDRDIAAIARGFGAEGIVVRTLDDLRPLRDWVAQGPRGVFVVDAKVTPDLVADWLEEAFRGEH